MLAELSAPYGSPSGNFMFAQKVIVIANASWYPPEWVVVLRRFILGNSKSSSFAFVLCCSRAMNSNGFASPLL